MRKKDPRKEEAIYQAVLSLCRNKGLHATTMSDIAKEAGVASGTLYIYFNGKEELFHEMAEDLIIERSRSIEKGLHSNESVEEMFENFWFTYLEYLLDNADELYFLNQYNLLFAHQAKDRWQSKGHLQILRDILNRGMKSGEIHKGPIEVKIHFTQNSLEQLVIAHARGAIILNKENIAEALRLTKQSLRSSS